MERRGEDHLAGSDSQSNSDLQFKIATPSLASSMNVKVSLPVRGKGRERGFHILNTELVSLNSLFLDVYPVTFLVRYRSPLASTYVLQSVRYDDNISIEPG